jgi:hypothetical protein
MVILKKDQYIIFLEVFHENFKVNSYFFMITVKQTDKYGRSQESFSMRTR